MNINTYTSSFFDYEIENNFFYEQIDENIYYWDIIRHDIFYYFYEPYKEIKQSVRNENKYNKQFNIIKTFIKIIFSNNRYLFVKASRNNGTDIISNPYINSLNNVIEIDTIYANNNNFFNVPNIFRLFRKDKTKYKIANLLSKKYNVDEDDLNIFINKKITKFKNDYFFYKLIFKFSKPKVIFMVQNGIQKAMFKAANDLNIPIVELQHGYIGKVHPAYSYPKNVNLEIIQQYMPKYFFTFSNFWSQNSYYPLKKFSLGADFIKNQNIIDNKNDDITIVSANIYHIHLKDIANSLALNFPNSKIYYKLHPNQFHDFESILNEFTKFQNIEVISNQYNLNDLFFKCHHVVLIQSTATYEALNNKNNVYLYKVADYQTHDDVFEYLELFDNTEELIEKINNNIQNKIDKYMPTFFEPFNKEKFLQVLQEIESK